VTRVTEFANARSEQQAEFEALVRQYGGMIDHVVVRVAGRHAALVKEDVRQNVLLAIWKQLDREQEIQQVASYIYKAAVREAVRARRRETAREAREQAAPTPLPRATEDPHQALLASETAVRLKACLQELGPDRLRAVRGHLAGFDVSELMESYGWSYQKARNLVSRGMRDLRDALRRRDERG
jgi:RNA polymerase sigma factor (sigma-70 family)